MRASSINTFALLLGFAATTTGCELIATADRSLIPSDDGGGGTGAQGGGGSGGVGGAPECTFDMDCGVSGECLAVACESGMCVTTNMPNTTPCGDAPATPCEAQDMCDGQGSCADGGVEPATTVCRPSVSSCDAPELCDGISTACPADEVEPDTTVCRAGSGDVCDPPETCNGTDAFCPIDVYSLPSLVCRVGSGDACNPDETCTGVAGQGCPPDVVAADTTPCTDGDICSSGDACSSGVCTPAATDDCVLWCFEDATPVYITTPTIGTGTFAPGGGLTVNTDDGGNDIDQPTECPGEALPNNRSPKSQGWGNTSMATAVSGGDCFEFTMNTGADPLVLQFDDNRSGPGPQNWGVQVETSGGAAQTVVMDQTTNSAFASHPQNVVDLEGLGIANDTGAIVRICGYNATTGSGTWQVDNVLVYTGGCFDGLMNQDETDIDCGGAICAACP